MEFMKFIAVIGLYYFTENQAHFKNLKTNQQKIDAIYKWIINDSSKLR